MVDKLPGFKRRMQWFIDNHPEFRLHVEMMSHPGAGTRRLLAIVGRQHLPRGQRQGQHGAASKDDPLIAQAASGGGENAGRAPSAGNTSHSSAADSRLSLRATALTRSCPLGAGGDDPLSQPVAAASAAATIRGGSRSTRRTRSG